MKRFLRNGSFIMVFVLTVFTFSACSQESSAQQVKVYNNDIVQIQKDMFSKAQDASAVFKQQNLDPQKVLSTLQSIQSQINASHDKFKGMSVPGGAEQLSDAMERFFQIEINGIQKIIAGVQQIQGHQSDSVMMKNFSDTFSQFSLQENTALKDFYSTQQMVAQQFGQKVVQTNQNQN